MTRQKRYTTESDGKEYNTIYAAASGGTRRLAVYDEDTGALVDRVIDNGRPADTKNKKNRQHHELFIMVYTRVIDAINNREIEGNEILVLMNCISRISKQNNYVVNEKGVKMSLRQIAESSGIDKNQFNKAVESLEYKGFLSVISINKKSKGILLGDWIAGMGKPLAALGSE